MFRQYPMNKSRRSVHYPGIGSVFYLPQTIWVETIEAIKYYGEFHSEGLVYWGGVVGALGETLVTSLLRLNHMPQGGRVQPTPDEMRSLLHTLRKRDEKLVAQIHSHLGEAFHSLGDSQKATSFHPGFLSIVLPNFGYRVQSLSDCAVYEFRDEFESLTPDETNWRLIVQPNIVDLMPRSEYKVIERSTLWSTLSKKLKFTAFKKQ